MRYRKQIEFTEEEIGEIIYADGFPHQMADVLSSFVKKMEHRHRRIFAETIATSIEGEAREFFKMVVDKIRECETPEISEEPEEDEKEVFYKVGDRFDNDSGIYKLHSLGNKMAALVKVERLCGCDIGHIWETYDSDYNVKDVYHITHEEFARIACGWQEDFKLIKEEEEVFYKVGDRFKTPYGIYRISSLGDVNVSLIKIESSAGYVVGYVWTRSENRRVNDKYHITQEEFKRITDGCCDYFTLIKEEEAAEKEQEEEVFYKVGDRFYNNSGIFRLSTLGTNGAALACEEGYQVGCICWASNYDIKDRFHITKEEFARIAGNLPQRFAKVIGTKNYIDRVNKSWDST